MEDKTLNFELTVAQANVILQALANCPYSVAAPLIDLLKLQASSQLNQQGDAEESKAPEGN